MNKKIIAALVAALVVAGGNAAFADYKWFAGGSAGVFNSSTDDSASGLKEKVNSFNFSPTIGYIIDDKSDVSISIGYANADVKTPEYDPSTSGWYLEKYKATEFSIGAGYERLFLTVGNLYFYLWGGVTYSSVKEGDEDAYGKINISVEPNVQYGITDNIILFASLNFLSLNFDSWDGHSEFSFGADANDVLNTGAVQIGLSYLF